MILNKLIRALSRTSPYKEVGISWITEKTIKHTKSKGLSSINLKGYKFFYNTRNELVQCLIEIFTEEFSEVITQTKIYILDINGLKKDLQPGTYTLGRGTEVDIQIHDPGISRKHLSITVDEKVVVTDLNSTNGTFLGSDRVQEIIVEDTISFRVGVTEIKIVIYFR